MQTGIDPKRILELQQNMPIEIAHVAESEETANTMLAIGKKYGITIDKIGRLNDELWLVLIGASPAREFIKRIELNLPVDDEKAIAIAKEINSKVFAPIRESLKRMHGISSTRPFLDEPTESTKIHPSQSTNEAMGTKKFDSTKQASTEPMSDRAYWEAIKTAEASKNQSETIGQEEKGVVTPIKTMPAPVLAAAPMNQTSTESRVTQPESKLVEEVGKLLGGREMPKMEVGESQLENSQQKEAPQPISVTTIEKTSPVPPTNLPTDASSREVKNILMTPPTPTPPITQEAPKPYNADPYREPIDEGE